MSSTPPGREPYEPGRHDPEDARPEGDRPDDAGGRAAQDDTTVYPQPHGAGYQGGPPPGSTGTPYQGVPYQGSEAPPGTAAYPGYPEPGYADADYQSTPRQPYEGAPYQGGQYQGGGQYQTGGQYQGGQYQGTPYGGGYRGTSYGGQAPRNGMGLAALILAVISLLIAWIPFLGLLGGLGGLIAVVLGAIGLGRAKRGEATNRGTAIAGIVIGVLAILLAVASTMFGSFLLSEVLGPEFQACMEQYGDDPTALQRCLESVGTGS
ncbi:hypothetical protein KZX45_05425 [Georgenia sp. EYE_87]|uniref:DUF4190 domain-containing protein n=1 Tax=Georgenia sp. EYE_87 TaxID=2853448 RepID=UPI002005D051|nr:DUF4190 domain-containing protein [Georgenia sp. EYE_87]MCK6209980.1 hypothetical protein [Georgenia sp. EYE_87]